VKHICAETNRPVKDLKDIFVPPNQANGMIGPDGVSRSDLVLMSVPFRGDSEIEDIASVDANKMPGRIHFGDVASDGYPDIMLTVKNRNGTSTTHILMNDPCNKLVCNVAAKEAKRRVFV
jgi:predicted nucleic acid-binding Zn finger protein